MPATNKLMAILRIPEATLCQVLQLPSNAEITNISMESGWRGGQISITLEGAGWEARRGLPIMTPSRPDVQIELDRDGIPKAARIDWNLPKDT